MRSQTWLSEWMTRALRRPTELGIRPGALTGFQQLPSPCWAPHHPQSTRQRLLDSSSVSGDSAGKESACNVGELGLIPGLGRSPGERNGYSPQYPSLQNFVDRRARWATVHWVVESDTAEQLLLSLL